MATITTNNVINFIPYKERAQEIRDTATDDPMDVFDLMTEEDLLYLLNELEEMYGIEEPANDIGFPYETILTFTPEGSEIWNEDIASFDFDLD